jgi:tetratricopeptide (TPR) repeat protein
MDESAADLLDHGRTLIREERLVDAVAVFDHLVGLHGADAASARDVADALIEKGEAVERLGHDEEAVAAFNAVLERFGTASDPALHRRIAWALMSRAVILARLDRSVGALTCYDEVVRRFGESSDAELAEFVAQALMRSGYLHAERGDYKQAIAAADALRSRPEAGWADWRAPVAWATLNKGLALHELRRNDDAIAAFDEVIAFATESDEPEAAGWLACALFHKALCLTRSDRPDEGTAAYDALIARFAYDSAAPEVGYYVRRAVEARNG